LASDEIDGVMVIHAPPLESAVGEPIAAIDGAAANATKPVVAVLLGARDGPIAPGSSVPGFAFPEAAAAVLGRSYAYGRWQQTEAAAIPTAVTDVDDDAVATTVATALVSARTGLDVTEVQTVLGSYRIEMPAARLVPAGDALAAAQEIGFPVAIKARRRHVGRSLRAGIALDLTDTADVVESVRVMREELGADADEVVVQAMTTPGVDLRIRVTLDDRLGPLVTVGLGGVGSDLLADEDVRLAPLSAESARALVAGSRAGPALDQAGIAPDRVVDTLIRTAQLAAEHPELVEVDLNPVITTSDGCCVTDAVVLVAPAGQPEGALRQL
jgi:acyl-CoA synthetase (NDP forming)